MVFGSMPTPRPHQQPAPVIEAVPHLGRGHRGHAGGGQFDRQRDSVKLAADLGGFLLSLLLDSRQIVFDLVVVKLAHNLVIVRFDCRGVLAFNRQGGWLLGISWASDNRTEHSLKGFGDPNFDRYGVLRGESAASNASLIAASFTGSATFGSVVMLRSWRARRSEAISKRNLALAFTAGAFPP